MRILSGLLLQACFTLGMALAALLHLVKLQGGESIPESAPYAGIGQKERIVRPAFLSGIQD